MSEQTGASTTPNKPMTMKTILVGAAIFLGVVVFGGSFMRVMRKAGL